MTTAPVRVPVVVGLNVTLRLQIAPFAIDVAHELVCVKSPVVEMDRSSRGAAPVFSTCAVNVRAPAPTTWFVKKSDAGSSITDGASAWPTPDTGNACGPPGASSAIVTRPALAPSVVGVKVTVTVQVAPPSSALEQVFDCVKSPVVVTVETVTEEVPILRSVTVCVVLAPTSCDENSR